MDSEHWISRLAAAKRFYIAQIGHAGTLPPSRDPSIGRDLEHWISRLAAAKRFYAAQLGHADRAGMDELEMDGDENAGRPDLVCPYCYKEHPFEPHAAFIFSISFDGKIQAWFSRVEYDAPGKWCTAMLYNADGTRLFSCGTSKEGDSHLVERKQSEGSIERTYSRLRKTPSGVVRGVMQFDTAHSHILAAGEENRIKFWDVDNTNMLLM